MPKSANTVTSVKSLWSDISLWFGQIPTDPPRCDIGIGASTKKGLNEGALLGNSAPL
jgi:hypothetical protein